MKGSKVGVSSKGGSTIAASGIWEPYYSDRLRLLTAIELRGGVLQLEMSQMSQQKYAETM